MMASVRRMMTISTTPPKKPLMRPSTTPTQVEMAAASTPTSRLTRVPLSSRLSWSRPIWSVPSQCWADGGWEKPPTVALGE